MEVIPGVLVRSKAGRDKNKVYLISSIENKNIYVTDGDKFPVGHEKKKNKKHLQPIKKMKLNPLSDDQTVKEFIIQYLQSCEISR